MMVFTAPSPDDWQNLSAGLAAGAVIRERAQRARFYTDTMCPESIRALHDACAIVLPTSSLEIQHVVRWAACHGMALVPQGGHTNRTSAAIPLPDCPSLIVNLERHNQIDPISSAGDCVALDAGVTLGQLQKFAAQYQRWVGVDIGARDSAQIGGMLATNAGGMQSVRYGSMRAQCLGLEVVTGNGEILSHMQGLYKNNTGYDWTQLFIGAEGTLGVISRAIMKLYPAPAFQCTALLSVYDASACVAILREAQSKFDTALLRIEFIADLAWQGMCATEGAPKVPWASKGSTPPYLLLLDVAEHGEVVLNEWLEFLLQQDWISDAVIPQSLGQQQDLWHVRDRGAYLHSVHGPLVRNDIALRPENIPDFLVRCHQALQDYMPGLMPLPFGHLGDGNLHYNIAFPACGQNLDIASHKQAIQALVEDFVVDMGGTFSAEHGIGSRKLAAMERHKDPSVLHIMHKIKRVFDPNNICNPGKLLPQSGGKK